METIQLERDITVFFIKATSFPEGIMDAHKKLCDLIPDSTGRNFFGVSGLEDDAIIYRAAAEEIKKDEARQLNCDTLVLKKGHYICLTITDYLQDIQSIGKAFKELLEHPAIDPYGYCVEWYRPAGNAATNARDVQCMIRLRD